MFYLGIFYKNRKNAQVSQNFIFIFSRKVLFFTFSDYFKTESYKSWALLYIMPNFHPNLSLIPTIAIQCRDHNRKDSDHYRLCNLTHLPITFLSSQNQAGELFPDIYLQQYSLWPMPPTLSSTAPPLLSGTVPRSCPPSLESYTAP